MRIDCFGRTDIGLKRTTNQDHYIIADLRRSMTLCDTSIPDENQQRLIGKSPGKLLAVADGIGGQAGGDRASEIALTTLSGYVLNMMYWFLKLSDGSDENVQEELAASLSACEADIRRDGLHNPEYESMGTTITMAYIVWPRMYVVHAGDSRCYVLREGELVQLTNDHSVAQDMVSVGAINPEEAKHSRWRHVLSNAIGGDNQEVYAEVQRVDLCEGDVVLLCTDGLHGFLGDDVIVDCLQQPGFSTEQITEDLITAANQEGGHDNITAIAARFDGNAAKTEECTNTWADTSSALADTVHDL